MESEKGRHKILVVDDEPTNIRLLERILRTEYEILEAESGNRALEIVVTEPVDLVLLDVMMPIMDGFAVCHALRKNPETREIPVIFISAMKREEFRQKGTPPGTTEYIEKPVNAPKLKEKVKHFLETLTSGCGNLQTASSHGS